ncbi:hypothetical protein IGI04_042682 [Brassica rapa subsp. trilocularis]|uniref:Uncharacterized protein n=1 Tax=Brassica rapa subsp. trilocularis TaxID=1813537 RepID=A0ABQ7KIP7_BRACM|nr:hypothetical protein IGI04_042682 [Brassica rapa subsp. trilocularis]
MSLNELQDQEHITLTAALKSLIHPFALSFKYPQITGLPHGKGGDLLLLVCLEPGAQQPCGLRFLNRLLHTRTFPLLHTMVGLPLVCLEPGAQQPRGLRFLNQLLHTSIFPLLHTMVQVFLFSWIGGEQRTLLVNLKHHSNSSKDKTQEYWDQSLESSGLIPNLTSNATDRHKALSSTFKSFFTQHFRHESNASIHQTKLLKYPGTDSKHFNLSIFNSPQVFNHITQYNQSTTQAHYQEGFTIAYTMELVLCGSYSSGSDEPGSDTI